MAISKIPTFYRIFFLYIDPLICFSSIYIFFLDQAFYLKNGIPQSVTSKSKHVTPLTQFLLFSLGSYSLFVFLMQICLLHGFKDAPRGLNLRIWRIVQFGILCIDVGIMFAFGKAGSVEEWGSGDWSNVGILAGLMLARGAFLVGIGF